MPSLRIFARSVCGLIFSIAAAPWRPSMRPRGGRERRLDVAADGGVERLDRRGRRRRSRLGWQLNCRPSAGRDACLPPNACCAAAGRGFVRRIGARRPTPWPRPAACRRRESPRDRSPPPVPARCPARNTPSTAPGLPASARPGPARSAWPRARRNGRPAWQCPRAAPAAAAARSETRRCDTTSPRGNRPSATIDARSRCVAATIRTSTLIGFSAPTRSIQPSCRMRNMRTWAAGGNSPISSRNSVPPSARSNQPRRASTAPVNAPRSWPNSCESISSGGIAPQLTRSNGPLRRDERLWIARAINFLARARLAEDQHGGVAAGDQFHPIHHGAKPRFHAHDRVAERLASQPGQQRAFVGLGGLAQGGHLAQPKVVVQGHRNRLQEQLDQFERVRGRRRGPAGAKQDQHAAVAGRIAQGSGQHVALVLARGERRAELRRRPIRSPRRCAHLSAATPFQQRSAVRRASNRSGRRAEAAPRAAESDGHGFQARSGASRSAAPAPARPGCGGASMAAMFAVDWPISMCRQASCQTFRSTCWNCSIDGKSHSRDGRVLEPSYITAILSYITAHVYGYLTACSRRIFAIMPILRHNRLISPVP